MIERNDNPEPNGTKVPEEAKARIRKLDIHMNTSRHSVAENEATGAGVCRGRRVRPLHQPSGPTAPNEARGRR